MTKVFVTGTNGLLGTNLVLELVEKKYSVVALVRNKKSFLYPKLDNVELVEGDLLDVATLSKKMKSCKFVVHTATNTSQNLLSIKDYDPTNVQGTKNIITACITNNIEKLIYIGTANTYGYGSLSDLGNESKLMKYPFTKSLYAISKKQAQDVIDQASSKLNITTISPTFMIGAYDTKPSSGKLILSVLNKRIAFYPLGGKSFIYVQDVVIAILKALKLKETGQKYILCNENMSYKDFFKKVVALNDQKTWLIPIPNFMLFIVGIFGDFLRFFKFKIAISSINTKTLTVHNYYSNHKAKEALNMVFTPIEIAIEDALNYFNQTKK